MILATLNLSSGEWSVVEDEDLATVAVGFSSDQDVTAFDNLSFGWEFTAPNAEPVSFSYPQGDIVYVSTDQSYMVSESISSNPDDECVVSLWAENAGERYETTYAFVVPCPASPFSSWVWDTEVSAWQAPVPMPEDENVYVWDEDSGAWVIYGLDQI